MQVLQCVLQSLQYKLQSLKCRLQSLQLNFILGPIPLNIRTENKNPRPKDGRGFIIFRFISYLFVHDKDEAATRLAENLCGEAIDGGDIPRAIRGIGKELDLIGWLDKAEIERERLSLIETIDACHIPRMAKATGKDCTLAWITTHKARLIPHIWQLREEILYSLRLGEITLWLMAKSQPIMASLMLLKTLKRVNKYSYQIAKFFDWDLAFSFYLILIKLSYK